MESGIIGLPLSGKTTLFNALTGMNEEVSSHEGGKKEVNIADVEVPDERVAQLFALLHPKKMVQATVRFKDIQMGFTAGGGIASSVIAEMRNSDALTIVLRAFESEEVPHPQDSLDPLRDLRKILDALILSDYEVAEKRLDRLTKEAKKILWETPDKIEATVKGLS